LAISVRWPAKGNNLFTDTPNAKCLKGKLEFMAEKIDSGSTGSKLIPFRRFLGNASEEKYVNRASPLMSQPGEGNNGNWQNKKDLNIFPACLRRFREEERNGSGSNSI